MELNNAGGDWTKAAANAANLNSFKTTERVQQKTNAEMTVPDALHGVALEINAAKVLEKFDAAKAASPTYVFNGGKKDTGETTVLLTASNFIAKQDDKININLGDKVDADTVNKFLTTLTGVSDSFKKAVTPTLLTMLQKNVNDIQTPFQALLRFYRGRKEVMDLAAQQQRPKEDIKKLHNIFAQLDPLGAISALLAPRMMETASKFSLEGLTKAGGDLVQTAKSAFEAMTAADKATNSIEPGDALEASSQLRDKLSSSLMAVPDAVRPNLHSFIDNGLNWLRKNTKAVASYLADGTVTMDSARKAFERVTTMLNRNVEQYLDSSANAKAATASVN